MQPHICFLTAFHYNNDTQWALMSACLSRTLFRRCLLCYTGEAGQCNTKVIEIMDIAQVLCKTDVPKAAFQKWSNKDLFIDECYSSCVCTIKEPCANGIKWKPSPQNKPNWQKNTEVKKSWFIEHVLSEHIVCLFTVILTSCLCIWLHS